MSVSTDRLDYLDAVRAFALLLGIVFHASLSFMPIYIGWAVMDISTSPFVPGLVLVSHSFRMGLFFLIAGFFSHMTLHRKGAREFLQSRLVRIAIPFVVGWFLLKPLVISGWVMGAESMRGEVNILNGLKSGFATFADLPEGVFVETHLWFLYYLLMVTGIVLLTRLLLRLVFSRHRGGYEAMLSTTDRMIAWLSRSRLSLLALSVPTALCLWFMNGWGMDTPDRLLRPQVPVLLVYGGFFTFGWLLHRHHDLIEQFARITAEKVVLCIAAIAVTLMLAHFQADPGHPSIQWIRAGFIVAYAIMMWSLVALSIGLFKRFLDRPSQTVRYIADSSYWLYLVHLPLVLWLQITFAELPLHWSIKLSAIFMLTVGIALLMYDGFVRSTVIGRTLNGRRKERVLFGFAGHPGARRRRQKSLQWQD